MYTLVLFALCLYVICAFGIVCCLCAIIKMLLYFLVPLFIFICKHALCLHHTHTHPHTHTYIICTVRICLFFSPSLLGNFRGAVFDYEPRCCCYGLCDRWERLILPTLRFLLCTFCRALCNHLAANFKSGSGAPREWEEKVLNIIKNIFGILGIPQIFKTHLKLDDIS